MTRKDQIKILDDNIKANNVQYDLDRMHAEISAYSSGDLPKYEYLTKNDLGYKPELIDDGVKVNNFDEMKKEIIDHVKKLKDQGADVKLDEDQINDLINQIFDKKYEKYTRKTYIEFEIDKFLKDYEDKNIDISYGDKGDKNKFDTDNITKSLKKLRNKFIDFGEFNEECNKFMDNVVKFEYYKSKKKYGSISTNQKK